MSSLDAAIARSLQAENAEHAMMRGSMVDMVQGPPPSLLADRLLELRDAHVALGDLELAPLARDVLR